MTFYIAKQHFLMFSRYTIKKGVTTPLLQGGGGGQAAYGGGVLAPLQI